MTEPNSDIRRLDDKAVKIFRLLTHTLQVGKARTISNGDAFMAVHVDRLNTHLFSIAHYHEVNGDLCCDPDMVFHAPADGVYVVSFQQAIPPIYQHVDSISVEEIQSMRDFANQWLRNIQEQQELEV